MTIRAHFFWTVLLLASQLAQGIAQERLRIEPRDETIAYSWEQWTEIRDQVCDEAGPVALWSPARIVSASCRDEGAHCTRDAQCCSRSCVLWRCR